MNTNTVTVILGEGGGDSTKGASTNFVILGGSRGPRKDHKRLRCSNLLGRGTHGTAHRLLTSQKQRLRLT